MKFETVKTRYGVMNIPTNDAVLGPSLRLYGEWAQDEIEGLSKLLKDGDVVIDAGANIGTHTLGFASAVAPSGRVYAFEPQCDIYELLQNNCRSNSYTPNIVTYCNPLSNISGKKYNIPLHDEISIHNFGATQLSAIKDDRILSIESFESMTIDDLNLNSCRLIKIDVEGMELEVLSGAATLISKCRPLIFFEANTISAAWEIIQNITAIGGYSIRVVISDAFSPHNFNENKLNIFSDYQETSILLYSDRENALIESSLKNSILITNYAELSIVLAILCRRPPGHPLENFIAFDNELREICNHHIDGLAKPILHELIYQREIKTALSQENDTLSHENDKLSQENHKLRHENHRLSQENDKLSQENHKLSQENHKLSQENHKLSQENTALGQDLDTYRETCTALSEHLRKYQEFPLIRLIRKLRSIVVFFVSNGKR